jgi:hypothetical protein
MKMESQPHCGAWLTPSSEAVSHADSSTADRIGIRCRSPR